MPKYQIFPQLTFNRRRCFSSYYFFYAVSVTVIGLYLFLSNMYRCAPIRVDNDQSNSSDQDNNEPSLRDVLRCYDKSRKYRVTPKGAFWALYNYIPADQWFRCHESITFTTTSDFTFLENLEPLVSRWKGPVSVALYTPGTDFQLALDSIKYVRHCHTSLIKQYVTFHVFFENEHRPSKIPKPEEVLTNEEVDCRVAPPWQNVSVLELYKSQKNLLFPINVGRNIARDCATTHFVLAADIELYPSANVIADFLEMARKPNSLAQRERQVFVLQPFEVTPKSRPPDMKEELVKMLEYGTAVFFHRTLCHDCHKIPRRDEWPRAEITPDLQVFHTTKRGTGWWEPFYIGTNEEPYFDEKLSWEGRSNKMTQAYTMCLLDYDYHILNNAFLVHKPGIKKLKPDHIRDVASGKNYFIIKKTSIPEMHAFFGTNDNCYILTRPKGKQKS